MVGTLTNMPRHTPIASDLEDPLALEQQVCFALSVAARNVVAVYKPLLEPMGLTHPKYLVMLALWQHEPLSVRDLSRLLQLDPGTLSPLLKRLEHLGLLRRGRDPHDERVLAVVLRWSRHWSRHWMLIQPAGQLWRQLGHAAPCGAVTRLLQRHHGPRVTACLQALAEGLAAAVPTT